jgi:tetratricopeptide (TPR) repeat protein
MRRLAASRRLAVRLADGRVPRRRTAWPVALLLLAALLAAPPAPAQTSDTTAAADTTAARAEPPSEALAVVDSLREAGAFAAARDTLGALGDRHGASAAVLWRLAVTYVDLGETAGDEDRTERLYRQGLGAAERAVAADTSSAMAHLAAAIAAGRVALVAGTREGVRRSRAVKRYAEAALARDSTLAGAHHVLGRWHYEVADLGFFARAAAKVVYGGLPDASFEQAAYHFRQALRYEDAILHHVELGRTYLALDRDADARTQLERALAMEPTDPDDPRRQRHARQLLDDMG